MSRHLLIVPALLAVCVIGLFRIDGGVRGLTPDFGYLALGLNLAQFGEFHNSRSLFEDRAEGKQLVPYSYREPGFPLYLAAVFASSPEIDSLSRRCFRWLEGEPGREPDVCEAAAPLMRRVWRVTSVLAAASVAFLFVVTFLLTRSRAAAVGAGLAGMVVVPMLATANVHDFLAGILLLVHATLATLTFRRPRVATGVACGLALGCLALTKAIFQYWLAGVVVVLAVGLWRDARRRRALIPACAALVAAAWVTAGPWMLRNAVVAGHFGVSLRGGEALAYRAQYDLMTWDEVRGAFAYWLPDVSLLGAARGQLMSWLEPETFGYTRFDGGGTASRDSRCASPGGERWAWSDEVAALADRIDPRWRESSVARDAALGQAALSLIRENWLKHAALTPAFALNGANVFPDRCRADVETAATRFRAPMGWPARQVCGAAGLAAFLCALSFLGVLAMAAWRRRDVGLALLLSPAVYAFAMHALATYFIGRHSRPLVPLLVVAAALGAHETRLWAARSPAARSARERLTTAIRRGAALTGVWALAVLGVAGCTSNPAAPTDVLFLQVNDIEIGAGREARVGDRVVIDYRMWAYERGQVEDKGQEVDSRTGYAFFLGANQVIVAFDQGLVGMRVGGLRRLVIPYRYVVGGGTSVAPGTPLVADVRMVDAQAVVQ